MEEKETGELLVCLAFTSDDRKWKLRLAAVMCAARWGHICANNSRALQNARRCHRKAFCVFSLGFFQGFGFSFSTEVLLAWGTTRQVTVNALSVNNNRSQSQPKTFSDTRLRF